MNALANDQVKRLRSLLENYPDITFGRYTGETKERPREAEEHFRKSYPHEKLIRNELLSREEMRRSPPHLLLTNYAMLEYLLLRPQDSEFFEGENAGRWRFFVLDEVHTYNGAIGIEMAMLLRRLKSRVEPRPSIRCLATSATLGRGREDFPAIVRFAQELFGEQFEWDEGDNARQDVVAAERLPMSELDDPWGEPGLDLYRSVLGANAEEGASIVQRMATSARRYGVPEDSISESLEASSSGGIPALLFHLMRGDGRLHRLRETLADGPKSLQYLADSLFKGRQEDLIALVDLAARARTGSKDMPLLPARYHLFVRALEGAYLALSPAPQFFLDRTESLERDGVSYPVFEAASCKRCGQVFLVGDVVDGRLKHATLAEDNRDKPEFYQLLGRGTSRETPADEDEEVAEGLEVPEVNSPEEIQVLCARCGAMGVRGALIPPCDCPTDERDIFSWWVRKVPTQDRQVNHCPSCGSRSPALVQRFLTGQDAPASVLATALYQEIPPRDQSGEPLAEDRDDAWNTAGYPTPAPPGGGRKLLVFSDSRQDAAFFACYLDRTYQQILRRRLIVKVLEDHPEAMRERWRIQDIVEPLKFAATSAGLFSNRDRKSPKELTKEVWTWLLLELMAFDRRHSLEGLGILSFQPVRPEPWRAPSPLTHPPWGLDPEEVWVLYQVLIESFRLQGAITFPHEVGPTDEAFGPRNRAQYFRQANASPRRGVYSWDSPAKGKQNRRLDYLNGLYRRINKAEPKDTSAETMLRDLWSKGLTADRSPFKDHLSKEALKDEGVVYRYRHEFFQLAGFESEGWHRCDRCGGLTRLNLRGVCPTYRCEGTLKPCRPDSELGDNHYAHLYRGIEPIPMVVEEHTAQLTTESAAELQDRFIQDEVNVLSCSTTFELGVDVGDLETVLLRNVPPEAANYIQRAGRAGRRSESTAFVLTFCQRRPHDLTHFHDPTGMIAGSIRPPHIELRNEKILRRHAHSVALAWFFRCSENREYFGTVEKFAFPTEGKPLGWVALQTTLETRPGDLLRSLGRIIPEEMKATLGVEDWSWTEHLFREPDGTLRSSIDIVRDDVARLEERREEWIREKKKSDFILRVINTIKEKDLIGFLANHNVLGSSVLKCEAWDFSLFCRSQSFC